MQCQRGVELLVELEHQRIVDLQMATQLVFEPYGVIDGFTAQLAEQIQLAEHGFGRLIKPEPVQMFADQFFDKLAIEGIILGAAWNRKSVDIWWGSGD